MKIFHCDHCGHLVFFENVQCVRCGNALAYLPDFGFVGSIAKGADGLWRSPLDRARDKSYRLCGNYTQHNVCNWAIPSGEPHSLCGSCRLTRVRPNPAQPQARDAWYRLEVAKRRLVYTLQKLRLPLANRDEDRAGGLAFEFLGDSPGAAPVLTGHRSGVITINIAEANDAEREKRRLAMYEPYRTLLGHFRHESGRYYWDRLVRNTAWLEPFRAQFGDERQDYAQALSRHHDQGPPADWQQRFVSAYASSHPWEDWAESWAHFLHMSDTLETAAACGLSLRPRHPDEPRMEKVATTQKHAFDDALDAWYSLTYVLNNLNRGLGLPDGYPFVLSNPAIDKLRMIHDIVTGAGSSPVPPATTEARLQNHSGLGGAGT